MKAATESPSPQSAPSVLFIGAGNMAGAMIDGLISSGLAAGMIQAIEPNDETRAALTARHAIRAVASAPAQGRVDAIVLAVKPQQAQAALAACRPLLAANRHSVLISIAAGLRCETLIEASGGHAIVVRAMPNTPALIREGVTGLYVPPSIGAEQARLARTILESTGKVVAIADEELLDSVTAVSGSGPAYVFYLIESMIEAGIANGLEADAARALVLATVRGAALLAERSDEPAELLRKRVTSPGGTTAAAIAVMEQRGFKPIVLDAISAARERGEALGKA